MNGSKLSLALVGWLLCGWAALADECDYFCIRVIDEATGRGVPLVELTTVNNIRFVTDSAGVVAFREPGLMDQSVFFHIKSHGYEYPADGFGYRGARLQVTAGGEATLRIKRINIAQRLYRITGAGIYRDSVIVGKSPPIAQPLLNAQVFGSDSVVNCIYRGKIYWFWGDTNRPSYPLGNFHVPGAVTELPSHGGLDPMVGINLDYFVDDQGFAKPMAKLPGKGPTWIQGLTTIRDERGRELLFTGYVKVEPPLKVVERGLAQFNDEKLAFEKLVQFDQKAPLFPHGHAFRRSDEGIEYVYFGNPFPLVRVPATAAAIRDSARYEAYTCATQGSREDSLAIDRQNGEVSYGWKTDTLPYTPQLQERLVKQQLIQRSEGLFQLTSDTGKPILIHSGSAAWNAYRKKWVMIGLESWGTSLLGEVWYAEADDLTGPWQNARKIVTHEQYSFYNPKQHPEFAQDNGRLIFFEGTYTNTFSGNADQTPRYNYNQVMYLLDLSDPRLR
jgi:hypothetical protein